MSPPLWVTETAAAFWRDAGGPIAVPRDIGRAVARSLPVAIVQLSALHVAKAEAWLRRQGIAADIGVHDRWLRACLVAQAGYAIIFVDGNDSEPEQRYSIAHEVAHFLHDYLRPRQEAVARLGPLVLEVLDGVRPARGDERAVGLLAGVPVRRHVHLMSRWEDDPGLDVAPVEAAADRLALELLAPWAEVAREMTDAGIADDRLAIARRLVEDFGLPRRIARGYAGLLCPARPDAGPLLQHLRASLGAVDHRDVDRTIG